VDLNNPGKLPVAGLRLKLPLPAGAQLVTANPPVSSAPGAETIEWALGGLEGEQRRLVTIQMRPSRVGTCELRPTALSDGNAEVQATHTTRIDVAPVLAVEALTEDDPVVGRETTCEVRIINQSATPASAVELVVQLPDNLEVVDLGGPTQGQTLGQQVRFGRMAQLQGRAVAVYRLRLRGQKPGPGRARIEVQAAGLEQPVQRELTCQVKGGPAGGGPGG
jgi:hypothetical protein